MDTSEDSVPSELAGDPLSLLRAGTSPTWEDIAEASPLQGKRAPLQELSLPSLGCHSDP